MDSEKLVDHQIDAGARLITQLVRDGFEIMAAFWVKTADEDIWVLYVATPLVEHKGLAATYRVLQASILRLQDLPLSLSDVKLVGAENPITRDVVAILNRSSGRLGKRYGGKVLGSMTIESAYIYPLHYYHAQDAVQIAREDVVRELILLMNRGPGILQPSRVTLKDGSSFEGIPFSIQMRSHRAMVVQFTDHAEPFPRVVDVDEIASVSH